MRSATAGTAESSEGVNPLSSLQTNGHLPGTVRLLHQPHRRTIGAMCGCHTQASPCPGKILSVQSPHGPLAATLLHLDFLADWATVQPRDAGIPSNGLQHMHPQTKFTSTASSSSHICIHITFTSSVPTAFMDPSYCLRHSLRYSHRSCCPILLRYNLYVHQAGHTTTTSTKEIRMAISKPKVVGIKYFHVHCKTFIIQGCKAWGDGVIHI